jgi:hypothetical protein
MIDLFGRVWLHQPATARQNYSRLIDEDRLANAIVSVHIFLHFAAIFE